MARSPQIIVYAESLFNIRQVSISLCLLSPADSSTTVEVLADGVTLKVCHKGESEKLILPDIVGAAGMRLSLIQASQFQRGGSGDGSGSDGGQFFYATWRLALAVKGQPGYLSSHPTSELTPVAWTSSDLLPESPVSCRLCGSVLISRGTIRAWKDLPAENWAEMMEFWHCHKPNHDNDHDHCQNQSHSHELIEDSHGNNNRTDLRGYGANSAISSQSGVGFVDLVTLFFSENDCRGFILSDLPPTRPPAGLSSSEPGSIWPIANELRHRADRGCREVGGSQQAAVSCSSGPRKDLDQKNSVSDEKSIAVSTSEQQPPPRGGGGVFCEKCHTRIGYYSLSLASVALFKWQIHCEATTSHLPLLNECFAATLVDRMSRFGSSKFLVIPSLEIAPPTVSLAEREEIEKGDQPILHIWVLNNNIRYTSSSTETVSSAVKLLFKFIPRTEANSMLEDFNSDVQEVTLPREAVRRIVELLETSNGILSSKEKSYREWKIGLLNK